MAKPGVMVKRYVRVLDFVPRCARQRSGAERGFLPNYGLQIGAEIRHELHVAMAVGGKYLHHVIRERSGAAEDAMPFQDTRGIVETELLTGGNPVLCLALFRKGVE